MTVRRTKLSAPLYCLVALLICVSETTQDSPLHTQALSLHHPRESRTRIGRASWAGDEYVDALQLRTASAFHFKVRPELFTVFFMTTASDYFTGMIRVFYDLVDAMLEHPQARVVVWGPGFKGWRGDHTIQENMNARFSCGDIDVHINFLAVFSDVQNADGRLYTQWEEYVPCPREVLFEELPDCHDYTPYAPSLKCELRAGHGNNTIVSARYAFLLMDLFYPLPPASSKMMVHTPDCASKDKVFPVDWGLKQFNASLVGATWGMLYPLRQTMARAIDANMINGGMLYEHPGYWPFAGDAQVGPEDYMPDAPEIRAATESYKHFITHLQHSKICLFDSSILRKSIAKFYEAFLAGCVVASDLPDEFGSLFEDSIIELDPGASQQQVAEAVNAALEDDVGLQLKAANGYRLGLEHFTCHRKAERILDYVTDFRKGYRGFVFPYGFRSRCKNYHFNEQRGRLLQPWCPGPRPERMS